MNTQPKLACTCEILLKTPYLQVWAINTMPKLWIAWLEVEKITQQIGPSLRCGTNYMLVCGLTHVQVEPAKIVPQIGLSPNFGACTGENSEIGIGNIQNAVW